MLTEIQITKGKDEEECDYDFVRINPDRKCFNDYEEFGKVSAYIAESIKKQIEESTKISLIDDFPKILLELDQIRSNHSIKKEVLEMDFITV